MSYYGDEGGISTVELALDSLRVADLKKVAALTGESVPTSAIFSLLHATGCGSG